MFTRRVCVDRYGIVILVFEAIGATTSFLYGLNHLFYTINDDVPKEVRPLLQQVLEDFLSADTYRVHPA